MPSLPSTYSRKLLCERLTVGIQDLDEPTTTNRWFPAARWRKACSKTRGCRQSLFWQCHRKCFITAWWSLTLTKPFRLCNCIFFITAWCRQSPACQVERPPTSVERQVGGGHAGKILKDLIWGWYKFPCRREARRCKHRQTGRTGLRMVEDWNSRTDLKAVLKTFIQPSIRLALLSSALKTST